MSGWVETGRAGAAGIALLMCGVLAGCGHFGSATAKNKTNDPLLGPPPGSPVAATPTSKTSNAALAGGADTPSTPPVTITPTGLKTGGSAWPPSAAASTGRPMSYDQAQAALAARGVQWQRLEAVGPEWKFTCSVPSRQDQQRSRTYEGRAATYLAAIQAVLEQMDREPS
jgi:hypothetical protein